jgi:hypothetical protein
MPGSPSGLHSLQPQFNGTTSAYAATSPTCSTNCVAGTAFCFGTLGAMDTGLELQQYMQHELGCAAAASQPEAAAGQMGYMGVQQPLQAQQQLGFMGMPAAGSGARTLSVADEAFDTYLDALMQHEMQQCMQQERQRQLQLQQQASTMNCAAPQMQFMGPGVSKLAPGHFAPVLQQPVSAYPGPAAAAGFNAGDGSEDSCNSSARLAADAYAKSSQAQGVGQPMSLEPAAFGADRLDACMQRGRRLQELLRKQQALKRSASAAVGSVAAQPCMEMPSFLQGPSRAAMPAQTPAMPAQFPAMPANLSCSSQQPTGAWAGLGRMGSTPVMTSTPVLLSEPAQAEAGVFSMHGMALAQHQGASGLQAQQPQQQQQHEVPLAERMARLQSQLADVSAQIQGLKQIVSSGPQVSNLGTAASTGVLCGVNNSFC